MTGASGRPVRILRVITRLNIGGPSIHAITLCRRLAPPAYESLLAAGSGDADEGDLSGLADESGVRRVAIPQLKRPLRPWDDARAWWALFRLIRRERPEIVHTHMAKAGALGRTAAMAANALAGRRDARCRIVHTFHGHVLDGYFSASASRAFVMIEQGLARATDCLVAVSPAIRDELLAKRIGRPEQWRVIPLGLNLSGLAELPPAGEGAPFRVGLIGRLVAIKNPGLFLSAFDRFRRDPDNSGAAAMVVGDGPLRPMLEREAKRLGVDRLVQFTGWQRNLSDVYGSLAATCLTSWNEGTPVAMIEAMAAGRPVVATDVGGVRDVLDDGEPSGPIPAGGFRETRRGLLVRPGDPDGLAAALATLAQDPELRARLGQAGRAHVVERFSEERLCRDISGLYESLVTRRDGCGR